MELGLSLGDTSSSPFVGFIEKPHEANNQLGLGFNTTLSIGPIVTTTQRDNQKQGKEEESPNQKNNNYSDDTTYHEHHHHDPLLQLELLPHTPIVARTNPQPQLSLNGSLSGEARGASRGFDVNRLPAAAAIAAEDEAEEGAALSSSPNNSAASSFQMDLCIYSRGGGSLSGSGNNYYNHSNKRDHSDGEAYYDQRGSSSRASDEDDNGGSTRKKLRLSKEQSAFLEESFKEHSTLNPKRKLALAKQLNLRPRQVEVWFQNRRARTKLKQTEVDCEYLKRCCETLTEENRRLHKELQELRALKTSNPFYMQLPATTLTMCPSCERVATNSNTTSTATPSGSTINNANSGAKAINDSTSSKAIGFPLGTKPKFYPFPTTS